jgi:hypothetical protein
MEISQEIPCVAIFTSNKQKCYVSLSFFCYKSEEKEAEMIPGEWEELVPVEEGKWQGKGRGM